MKLKILTVIFYGENKKTDGENKKTDETGIMVYFKKAIFNNF